MTEVYIGLDPQSQKITMKIDGIFLNSNSKFYNHVENEKLWDWIDEYRTGKTMWKGFLDELVEETNDMDFVIRFCGTNKAFCLLKKYILEQQERLVQDEVCASVDFCFIKTDNFESYREKMDELLSIAHKQASLIDSMNGMENLKVSLKHLIGKIENDCFKVIVFSKARDGKSSLINRLIDENVLPVKSFRHSCVMAEVKYGEHIQAVVYPKAENGGCADPFDIDSDSLHEYMDDPSFEKVEIFHPSNMLENGIVIMEMPSIGSSTPYRRITEYIVPADLIIYVISSLKPIDVIDRDFISSLNKLGCRNIIFALTFFDVINEEPEQVPEFVEVITNRLTHYTELGNKGVQFVSSLENPDGTMEPGIEEIRDAMERYLVKTKGYYRLNLMCRQLREINREASQFISVIEKNTYNGDNTNLKHNQEIMVLIESMIKSME